MVNLVINSVSSYFSPRKNIISDSEIDNGLNILFRNLLEY